MVTNYHAIQDGSAVRRARCEKCGCDYEYDLIRRSDAYTSMVFWEGERRLQARVAKKSAKKLAKMLETGVDPVACPDCGWYQSNMVREIRRRSLRPLLWIGILPTSVLAAFAGIFLSLFYSRILRGLDAEDIDRLWLAVVGSAVVAILCLGSRHVLNRFHNPNSRYPEVGPPLRGAPIPRRVGAPAVRPAAIPVERTADGTFGYARQRPEVAPGGWVTVQLARMRFPVICCNCMTPTDSTHKYQVKEFVV